MSESSSTRDDLCSLYLDQIPYEPYPVQEEALLAYFTAEQGVMVCAPTGTGKTLIAEAALFEALHTGQVAYYTTPLIALTDQKFHEMQEAAVRWGFHPDQVGLVTGNRCINPDATVRVVVAEILLNRLLHPEAFDFGNVSAVVMDEFHSFADPERGIVWELSLAMLPAHVRLLLLSATVGNSAEFILWLRKSHERKIQLVQSTDRKVPLRFHWVGDQLLNEQLEWMCDPDEERRKVPALVFCFNRDTCWNVAEQMRGRNLLSERTKKQLASEIDKHDWSQGAGPKLKQILLRGVGVHHAGLLPKYRRIIESLFQKKLLSICVCTETLAAGINLPARSVLLTSLIKGPPGKKKLIDPSSAHQMFGRAGRPQFDTEGHVFAIAHEDDVKIHRFQQKLDQIPEDTKDPNLIKARKRLKKKAPTRRKTEQYWNEDQFEKLIAAPPTKLYSKGQLPWRLLAYLLQISPDVDRLRTVVSKRLMDSKRLEAGKRHLTQMLITLWAGGFVTLDPSPPIAESDDNADAPGEAESPDEPETTGTLGALIQQARDESKPAASSKKPTGQTEESPLREIYQPHQAHPTPALDQLLVFRSINPVYGAFLLKHLGIADQTERIQALESVLEIPGTVARHVRVPPMDVFPPGPLATERLDAELLQRGLAIEEELRPRDPDAERDRFEERVWTLNLADKLLRIFQADYPNVKDVRVTSIWAAGDLLQYDGDFNKYVTSRKLAKQEGILFRHLLRMILLCGEFAQVTPDDCDPEEWGSEMKEFADRLTVTCRQVDPDSTDKAIEMARAQDVVEAESTAVTPTPVETSRDDFGEGVL